MSPWPFLLFGMIHETDDDLVEYRSNRDILQKGFLRCTDMRKADEMICFLCMKTAHNQHQKNRIFKEYFEYYCIFFSHS